MDNLTFGPWGRLLEKRPLHLAYLGMAVSRWAYVEQSMAFLYDYLLAQKGTGQGFSQPIDGLGIASFGAVRSTRTKLDLLYLAVEWRMDEAMLGEFKSVTARKVEAASKERNILAHGIVEYSDQVPDALLVQWNGQYKTYRYADFEATLDKIKEAEVSVSYFHNKRARPFFQAAE